MRPFTAIKACGFAALLLILLTTTALGQTALPASPYDNKNQSQSPPCDVDKNSDTCNGPVAPGTSS